jgi:[protein-PII] uridylyltransferase
MTMDKGVDALIDEKALVAEIDAACAGAASGTDLRELLVARLKRAATEGRERAWQLLAEERKGVLCAKRLSHLYDVIIREAFRFAVERRYRADAPSSSERMAVVAVGGYGRGTLAPGSDIDLLFLLPYKQTPWGESVAEFVLYVLWDLGLKVGHATRRVEECIRLSLSDMTIRTALLEARLIGGDEALFDEMVRRFDAEVVAGTSQDFIRAKLAERDERHKRQGMSRYLVEPNVKEGKGGLRDLHTLFWIAKYHYRVRSADELVALGVFSRAELDKFLKSEDFLWSVRCGLHFTSRRADDRLTFDMQVDIGRLLGYRESSGLTDVERFMKHYHLVAKDVGDLTRIFCAALEVEHVKDVPALTRVFSRISLSRFTGRKKPRAVAGSLDFVLERERLTVVDDGVFERDPVNLIRFFHVADRGDFALHPDALKLITRQLRLIDAALRDNAEANRLFMEILTAGREREATLRAMNEVGVLGRFITDFGKVVAMMQFNMYHHYTVDEHTLRAIGILAEMESGASGDINPLVTEIVKGIQNRRVLYLALFLHDIAKGRPEDHSVAGAKLARRLGPRFGLNPAETDLCSWLVEQHLTMSITAQSRDLGDRETIRQFASVVQTLERLKLLLILTVADIRAVGPGVWNGWKGQLLRTLYYETEPFLLGGHSQMSRKQRVAAAKAELAERLADWPEAERAAYLERHYPPYWLRVDIAEKVEHAKLIREADRAGKRLVTAVKTNSFEAATAITVVAPDHPRLLSTIAGSCTVAGGNIVDAQIFTTSDGMALDTITISREWPDDADEIRRATRVGQLIEATLAGRERLPESVARKAAQRRTPKAFQVPPQVMIDNALSEDFSVVEVSALDRPGLLFDLTRALSDLNLDIASAHIATFGERAVDVFYVRDLVGHKIVNPARAAAIKRRLMQAVGEEERKPVAKKVVA